MRLLLVETGSEQRLFITVNHLVMDAVTLGILIDELDRLCQLDERGERLRLARTSARFEEFSRWMNDFASAGATADLDFWRAQLDAPPPAAYDSRAHPGITMKDLASARHHLGPEETRALRDVRMGGRRQPRTARDDAARGAGADRSAPVELRSSRRSSCRARGDRRRCTASTSRGRSATCTAPSRSPSTTAPPRARTRR